MPIGLLLNTLEEPSLQLEIAPEEALPPAALDLIDLRRSYSAVERDIDAILRAHRRKRRLSYRVVATVPSAIRVSISLSV